METAPLEGSGKYTAKELAKWNEIRDQVIEIASKRIDETPDETPEKQENQKTKQQMAVYVTSLCNPRIDTVICQGAAGSGKTFTAMLCGLLALKEGLLEEIIHTRPLVQGAPV